MQRPIKLAHRIQSWLNRRVLLRAGPGCSSMAGLLSENGPFYPDAKGNLIINDWAWNKKANVLYVESPAGVGFSYSDRPTPFNDNKTASDNYEVLYKFFQGYTSFASNPLCTFPLSSLNFSMPHPD